MSINDMSLINGGVFDLGGNWITGAQGHLCHRTGTSVDLDRAKVVVEEGIVRRRRFCRLGDKIEQMVQEEGLDCARVVEIKSRGEKRICPIHLECPKSAATTCPSGVPICVEPAQNCELAP